MLKKGIVKLSQSNIEFSSKAANINQVRIVPRLNCYVIEVVYTVPDVDKKQSQYAAGVDLGLTNLMAVTSNRPGLKPLLVNGRPLKSINQFFNKRLSKAQSKEACRQIKERNRKRNNRIDNYLHTASRRVINWCIANDITTLVIGNNQGWKQSIKIGKRNNQQFTKIPHSKLINMLIYKGELAGIQVIVTEESYTSKASALDGDTLPKYKPNSKHTFSGRRTNRGLYKASTGKTINAEISWKFEHSKKSNPKLYGWDRGASALRGFPPL